MSILLAILLDEDERKDLATIVETIDLVTEPSRKMTKPKALEFIELLIAALDSRVEALKEEIGKEEIVDDD